MTAPESRPGRPGLRRFLAVAGLLAFATVWMPATQCLALNFVDPWFTNTMVGSAVDAWQEGEPRWPDYRPVDLESLPSRVPQAAITAEDQRFFDHNGFDWEAIQKAWEHNQKGGSMRGGSTISQQVARNVFLWQGRSWIRKGLEAWYTVWLELLVPKRRILELYLNVAETGPQTFGVEAGAQRWYGKPAAKLTSREAATIIALLPAPSKRTPKSGYVQKKASWILNNRVAMPEGYAN